MPSRPTRARCRALHASARGPRPRAPGPRSLPWTAAASAVALVLGAVPGRAWATVIVRWTPNGAPVCLAASSQQNVQVVPDGAGGVIVTWEDRRTVTGDIYAQRLRANGTADPSWPANGVGLCTAAANQTVPHIVTDGAGGAIVAWQDFRSGTILVYAQKVLAGGAVDPAWPANGVAVCPGGGASQTFPRLASDGMGGAIVVWQDERNGNTDIYAQRVLAGGTVDPGWPVAGLAVCRVNRDQSSPRLVPDGAGGAIVTWSDPRFSPLSFEVPDIYAQRVLASGIVDPAWPTNGRALCAAVSTQLYPEIVADGEGGAIVTWFDRRTGQAHDPIYQDIYVQRVNSAGVPQWTQNGVAVCTSASTQTGQQIVTDGAGGAIIAWQDHRTGTTFTHVYGHRVLADGSLHPGIPAQGIALCTFPGSQESPQLVADGAGGAIVAWRDTRVGSSYDLYAQRMRADGTVDPGWPADGLALCTADNTQQNLQMASDGAGGAIVAWQDTRGGGTQQQDLYAQRVGDDACPASKAAAPYSILSQCGVVGWTNASSGRFLDGANWNHGVGPVPAGLCPVGCSPYDALFGIGGAAYGVEIAGSPDDADVTIAAGDHPTFHLAGNTYRMNRLIVGGAGSGLTILGGAVAVQDRLVGDPGSGTLTIGDGASLVCDAAQGTMNGIQVEPGGALICAGSLSTDLVSAGTVSPGSNVDGPGLLAVNGSYAQATGGKLIADLGGDTPGSGYDVLRVAGPATLGGALEWRLVGGFRPALGQQFEVLVAHPLSGEFDSVGENIQVVYTDTSVVLIADETTPVLASLVSAETEPGRVHVRWHVSGGGPVTIRRDRGAGAWEALDTRFPDGTGMLDYVDTGLPPGRYGYRLGLPSDAGEVAAGEVWVEVPATNVFGLVAVSPNPATGPLRVTCSLADAAPARLELFDPAGRLLESTDIASPRPGGRVLDFGAGAGRRPGVYLLRLSQGARRASLRVAVVR